MKPFSAPSISIDGEAIRRIREEGKLTQLYVSKVVGVTTDTVSRWENNRYPTMRRDNALKLAEALEVDLAVILKKNDIQTEEPVREEPTPRPRKHLLRNLILVSVSVISIIMFLIFNQRAQVPLNLLHGLRTVPRYTAPGARVPIRLEITSKKKLKGLIVKEEFPPGWNLVEADPPPASVDNLKGNVRWMIRNPEQLIKIIYVLRPPLDISLGAEIHLSGEVVANPDGQRFSYRLPSGNILKIAPMHWADINGNSKIDDLEILEVSDMVDASNQIHFSWDLIEKMWDAGGYFYDEEKHVFMPQKISPAL